MRDRRLEIFVSLATVVKIDYVGLSWRTEHDGDVDGEEQEICEVALAAEY